MKIGQAAGDWNDELIDENSIAPMQSMLDLKGMDKNDNVSVDYVDGKLTFSTKNYYSDANSTWGDEVSMNSEQMFNALPNKDIKNDERILKDNKTFSLQGTVDGKNGEPNYFDNDYAFGEEKANFEAQIKNEKQFQDIASRRMEGINAPSLTQALRSRIDIPLSVLDNMFYDEGGQRVDLGSVFAGLDRDISGSINQDDLVGLKGEDLEAFKNNHEEMISALTNINHPAFDLNTSKDLLGDYYTNLKKQAYDANYKKQEEARNKNNPNNPSDSWLDYDLDKNAGSFYLDGETTQYSFRDMKDTANTIINIEKKGQGSFSAYDGNLYVFSKGKWSMMGFDEDGNQITVKDSDKNMMLNNLKFSNKPRILDYLGMNKKLVDHDGLSPTPLQFLNTDFSNPK